MYDRVVVRDYPEVPPSKCALCGGQTRHDGRKYIDLGTNVRGYGALYFCSICLGQICNTLGWLDPVQAAAIKLELDGFRSRVIRLEDENDRLRTALSKLDFVRVAIHTAIEDNAGSNESAEVRTGSVEKPDRKSIEPSSGPEAIEPGSDEPANVGRPSRIRDPDVARLIGSI